MVTPIIEEGSDLSSAKNKVEGHLEAASLHHNKAANYLKEGNYEQAAQNAILAQEYLNLASEAKKGEISS